MSFQMIMSSQNMEKKLDTDSFIVYIKKDDIYKDIPEDVETKFDTSNYELHRPISKGGESNWINER